MKNEGDDKLKHKQKPGTAAAAFVRQTLKNYTVAEYMARKCNIKGEMRSGQENLKTVPANAERT